MEAFNNASFSNTGNYTVSNSAAAINANDDVSTVDPDESILSLVKGPRRRQHDEDGSEGVEEDDAERLASGAIDGQKQQYRPEEEAEEKELPLHACAWVTSQFGEKKVFTDSTLQILRHS